jgi:hypothetical protein
VPRVITYTPDERARRRHFPLVPITTRSATPDDDYTTRLLKYIPAEAIALYTALIAGAAGQGWKVQLLLVGIGAVGDLLYLGYHVSRVKSENRPLPHYYVLSVVAFIVWAAITNPDFAATLHVNQFWRGIILVVTVFFIPLVDDWLARYGV